MEIRKLWDTNTEENAQYKNVCDVYGAEHLARLIGNFNASGTHMPSFSLTRPLQYLCPTSWHRPTWTSSLSLV